MATESALLSWMLALPAAGGGLIFALPAAQAKRARAVAVAFLAATLTLACVAAGWMNWDRGGEMQLISQARWLHVLGGSYSVGVDALSLTLVLLTAAMGVMAAWASYGISRSARGYFALLLWQVAALLGVFVARDLLLFFAFFELSLVPLFFLIGGWGGTRKEYAASKYFLFSMIAAILLLIVVIGIYCVTQGLGEGGGAVFDLSELANNSAIKGRLGQLIGPAGAAWSAGSGGFGATGFWLMLAACGIGMALFPVHTWLADVIAEAPTPVAMMAAAVMTKLGAYGLMRVGFPIFSEQAAAHGQWIGGLGAATILYAAFAALAQKDLRRMIAFGAIAQMGYVLLGLAVLTPTAVAGAAFQLVAQGISIAMLIFVTGMIADRAGHCEIKRLGGLAGHMPMFAGWSAVAFMTAMGLPGLCVFVGELLILLGTFAGTLPAMQSDGMLGLGIIGAGAMVLTGAGYIFTYQRVFLGAPKPEHSNVARLSSSEKWILACFAASAILFGVMPGILLDPVQGWVETWLRTFQ